MKAAIVVLSDPDAGKDALGRVFNALAAAYEYKEFGDEVSILFQGAGTRWIGELSKPDHPAHELFNLKSSVEHRFAANVSGQCKARPVVNGLSP